MGDYDGNGRRLDRPGTTTRPSLLVDGAPVTEPCDLCGRLTKAGECCLPVLGCSGECVRCGGEADAHTSAGLLCRVCRGVECGRCGGDMLTDGTCEGCGPRTCSGCDAALPEDYLADACLVCIAIDEGRPLPGQDAAGWWR